MAINYLNSVDLNKNYINNAAIQNLGTEPTPDTPGQVYFNTTSQALKVTVQTGFVVGSETYAWEEVGSDSVVAGTGIVITPGTGADAGNSVITNSGLINLGIVAGLQNWTITQSANSILTFASASADEIVVDSPTPGTVRIGLPDDVTIGNNLTITNDLTVSNDATVTGDLTVSGGGSFATLGVTGATSIGGLLTASSGLSVTGATLSANANTAIDLGANRVTNIADPTAAQDAATKAYVDSATVGGLIYQGAYNPVTNTPDIDRSVVVKTVSISSMGSGGGPFTGIANTVATTGTGQGLTLNVELNQAGNVTSATVANGGTGYAVGDTVGLTGLSGHSGSVIGIATIATAGSPGADIGIETGWTYTVVADGTFYGEAVGVGDVLISETDNPTNLVHWTTVQNNIDLASATQVGIGNVAAGTGISVAYVSGTATVTNTDTNTSNTATGTITAGQLSGTVTHAFGINTIVQTIDSSGNTVYCDVSRTTTTSVATITAVQATDITILVQKIG
jgi:fibronectin-binding autotransporter adhesin